jgi:hypothetical protein
MQKRTRLIFTISIFIFLGIVAGIVFLQTKTFQGWYASLWQSYLMGNEKPAIEHAWNKGMLYPSMSSSILTNQATSSGTMVGADIPEQYNLKMEFHSQAPLLEWDTFHEEMCEEASILLVLNYFQNQSMTNQTFETALKHMQEEEIQTVGEWKSTTVEELQRFIESAYPSFSVKIISTITADQIEQYIAQNIPVLLPMSGQTIGNPFYKAPGPVYHVLVIKGYTKDYFITHDVGTKRGKDYFYDKNIILNNIHDWDPTNIFNGAKKGFVILPR